MKNLFKNLMLVAVAAMAFTACQTDADIDQSVINKTESTTITLTAGFDEETRATMVDGDGEFLVMWESDDSIIFEATAIDGSTVCAEAINPVLKNDGASAEFTATFSKEIKPGTVKAYVSGYYYIYNWNWDPVLGEYFPSVNYNDLQYQYPEQNAPYYIVASAEFEYNGEEFISEPITFNHDFAYGKVTINDAVEVNSIEFEFNGGDYRYNLRELSDIEGNTFWFVADPMEVSKMDITVNTNDGVALVKSVDMTAVETPLCFEAGKVSTFSLGNFITKLDQPWGNATVDTNSIVFDWSDVENATSYDIVLYKGYETIDSKNVTVCEYTATGLEADTEYSLSIVAKAEGYADSDKATINATTLVDRSSFDTWANQTVEFAYMRKLTEADNFYGNGYLFSIREITGKPTKDDTFMYLAFNDSSVDFTKEGSYDIYDLAYSWCYIWLGGAIDGCNGYEDNYGLGWLPYHFYPNTGDTYQVYVDVVDGKPSVTVYACNASYWSPIKFKGTWTNVERLDAPVVNTEVEGKTVTVSWESVAGAANYTVSVNGTVVEEANTTCTYTFEGEYMTTYNISVVANPETGSEYGSSTGVAKAEIGLDPNAELTGFTSLKYMGRETTWAQYSETCPYYELTGYEDYRMELYVHTDSASSTSIDAGSYGGNSLQNLGWVGNSSKTFLAKLWKNGTYVGMSEGNSSMNVSYVGGIYQIEFEIVISGTTYEYECNAPLQ